MSAADGNSAALGALGCLLRLQPGKASADGAICTSCAASGAKFDFARKGIHMLKAVGWIVLIIFIIGLLVVLGVFKAIF